MGESERIQNGKKNEEYVMLAENVLYMDIKRYEDHRFLQNIVESRPYIII